jgi:hypothetical protein
VEVSQGIAIPQATQAGITTANISWGPLVLDGLITGSYYRISLVSFDCTVNASTTLTIPGTWYGDAKNNYTVHGMKDGVEVITAAVTHNDTNNVATFGSTVEVDGFKLTLTAGAGSDVLFTVGSVIASGTKNAGTAYTTNPHTLVIGQDYAIEGTGSAWQSTDFPLVDRFDRLYLMETNALLSGDIRYNEAATPPYEREYIRATATTMHAGWIAADHAGTGSLDYNIRNATLTLWRKIVLTSPSVLDNIEIPA